MKRSFLWGKISFLLNWSPVWCVYSGSFTDERFQIFRGFQKKIQAGNLVYVYLIIATLSLVSSLVDITYGKITEKIDPRPNYFNSWHMVGLSIANIVYHALLSLLLKVNFLRKTALKIVGFLNVLSLVLLQLYFGYNVSLLSSSNSLTTLTGALSISIFQNSVLLVYFQDSFLLSLFFWILVTVLTCSGVLWNASSRTANFHSVVSWTYELLFPSFRFSCPEMVGGLPGQLHSCILLPLWLFPFPLFSAQ